ncbi:MAG: hydrolase 1, exosortase A system-associated [Gammaproteobacteria bacterium]
MNATVRTIDIQAERLAGILHLPASPASRGVLIIVGGPQYRVGSHRQFVLLARALTAAGCAVLRFDYRGMGDSDGLPRTFEQIDADIRAGLDCLQAAVPTLGEFTLWGLCDGAAAGLLYAGEDPRVTGLVLLNPWVRTDETLARSYVSEYYARRVFEPAFWGKLLRGEVRIGAALAAFFRTLRQALGRGASPASAPASLPGTPAAPKGSRSGTLPERLLRALTAFNGRTLLILSGRDLTAGEFRDLARQPAWQHALAQPNVTRFQLDAADHTFSRRQWRDEVAGRCTDWLRG